jgi:hypothetical protein
MSEPSKTAFALATEMIDKAWDGCSPDVEILAELVQKLIDERDAARAVARVLERGGCWTPNPNGVELDDWEEVASAASAYPEAIETKKAKDDAKT